MSQPMLDEAFVKAQLVAFCKALNKAEAPLKQKHVRALIVGTHRQRSARIFWHAVSRVQLEKNPVLTWKFCHLLHKLIRDGHRRVTDDSVSHCSRLVQLGNFWQHLRTSGYGQANTAYCKMLVSRLQFHKKYPSIPGSLCLTPSQLDALTVDVNENYEWAIDVLDQLDELLSLKSTVTSVLDSLHWSSLVPQGQCLLAPLILVVLDTSKYYDFIVKSLFKLHSSLPPDALVGHRERFYDIFRKTKKFYEDASSLQYFKYLVSLPSLPSVAPNFLQASDLDIYQSPQAYLHNEATSESGDLTPPDAASVSDFGHESINTIIDLSMPVENFAQGSSSNDESRANFDSRDEIIASLKHDLEMEREIKEELVQSKEQLINEARLRIGQYETRLVQMQQEIDLHKQTAEDRKEELVTLRSSAESQQQRQVAGEEMEKRVHEKEQKFNKLKSIYDSLREEHIKALTEIRELRTNTDTHGAELQTKSDEICRMREVTIGLEAKSMMLETELGELKESIDALNSSHAEEKERASIEGKKTLASCRRNALREACDAALAMLEQSQEDLQNATSISYPVHIVHDSIRAPLELLDGKLTALLTGEDPLCSELVGASPVFAHQLANVAVNSASAAYTASIQHFEPVNDQARKLLATARAYYASLREADFTETKRHVDKVKEELEAMEHLVKTLPTLTTGDIDMGKMGDQLDEEMKRMDEAIKQAVAQLKQMQRDSKTKETGLRLEVNDKILDSCNALMSAVRILVGCSRDVQLEIVAAGRGTASPGEFYKRNHQWTEGLLSAARAVGVAATVLVSSADGLINGKGKFEHLIVAAQEIGASVAQLFVSSRVKADKGSAKLAELGTASKAVNTCTADVVAAVKSGQQTLSDEKLFDFTNFTLHEAKTKEMESQVRTLELEAELQKERTKLAALRRQHYHLASLVAAPPEGKNGID